MLYLVRPHLAKSYTILGLKAKERGILKTFFSSSSSLGTSIAELWGSVDRLHSEGYPMNATAYRVLFLAYVREGKAKESLEMIERAKHYGFEPPVPLYLLHLRALLDSNFGCAAKIFCVEMLDRHGCALRENHMHSIILEFVCRKQLKEASFVLHHMAARGCTPSIGVYNHLMAALCHKGKVKRAMGLLLQTVKLGIEPNSTSFHQVIHRLASLGMFEDAWSYFSLMVDSNCTYNILIFNSLLSGLFKHGRVSEAISLLDTIVKKGYVLNALTYTILARGFTKTGLLDELLSLLRAFLARPPVIDNTIVIACNAFLNGLSKLGKHDLAEELFQKIVDGVLSSSPDEYTYSIMIDCRARAGKLDKALELFYHMKTLDYPLNQFCFVPLVSSAIREHNLAEALKIWDEMVEKGYMVDFYTRNLFLEGLALAGMLDEAIRITKNLSTRGLKVKPSTCQVLVDRLLSLDRVEEASDLCNNLTQTGCLPLDQVHPGPYQLTGTSLD